MKVMRRIGIARRHHFRFARLSRAAVAARMVPVHNMTTGPVERTLERFAKGGASIDRVGAIHSLTFVFQGGYVAGRHMKVVRCV